MRGHACVRICPPCVLILVRTTVSFHTSLLVPRTAFMAVTGKRRHQTEAGPACVGSAGKRRYQTKVCG